MTRDGLVCSSPFHTDSSSSPPMQGALINPLPPLPFLHYTSITNIWLYPQWCSEDRLILSVRLLPRFSPWNAQNLPLRQALVSRLLFPFLIIFVSLENVPHPPLQYIFHPVTKLRSQRVRATLIGLKFGTYATRLFPNVFQIPENVPVCYVGLGKKKSD